MPEWTEVLQLEYGEKTKTNKTNKKKNSMWLSSRFVWKSSLIILRENIYMDTTFHALLFVIPIYGKCNPLSILLNKIETGCWDSDGDG